MQNQNCVRLYETFQTKLKLYMVMELLSGGELFHHISEEGRFSEQRAAAAVRDVASALQAIHAVQMVHCDIKVSSLF